MHSENPYYFDRDSIGPVFGRPCLHLIEVCWMNPWARLECVRVPKPDSKIDIYIYHMYGTRFDMSNTLKISASEQGSGELTPINNIDWPLKESSNQPRGKFLREFVTTITLPQLFSSESEYPYKSKLVQIRLEISAEDGSWKSDWYFEGISAVVQTP